MKKILFFLSLMLISVNALADGLTATLQQGDKMTPFYGVDAFKQAYEAASDGDVITLSSGVFNTITEVKKSITIIGACGLSETSQLNTIIGTLTISADNVKIEGVYFSNNVTLGNISNFHIKRCLVYNYFQYTDNTFHTNTLVDQCVIKYDKAIAVGKNYCIKNSTIERFTERNTKTNMSYITNCFIRMWCSSVTEIPYAIYKNNVLGLNISDNTSNYITVVYGEFYNNLYYRYTYAGSTSGSKYYYTIIYSDGCTNSGNSYSGTSSPFEDYKFDIRPDTRSFGKTGQDGTPVGITGGTGFSYYPSIPRITDKTIDSNTDAEGKLNVKITVKAE